MHGHTRYQCNCRAEHSVALRGLNIPVATGGKLTVVSEIDITFDGYPGRFMVANINNIAAYLVKTIVVKNRVYFITVLMPRDDPKASDPKVYEKLSMKFLKSFNLMKEASSRIERLSHQPRILQSR
jgi:hypothetical protein